MPPVNLKQLYLNPDTYVILIFLWPKLYLILLWFDSITLSPSRSDAKLHHKVMTSSLQQNQPLHRDIKSLTFIRGGKISFVLQPISRLVCSFTDGKQQEL